MSEEKPVLKFKPLRDEEKFTLIAYPGEEGVRLEGQLREYLRLLHVDAQSADDYLNSCADLESMLHLERINSELLRDKLGARGRDFRGVKFGGLEDERLRSFSKHLHQLQHTSRRGGDFEGAQFSYLGDLRGYGGCLDYCNFTNAVFIELDNPRFTARHSLFIGARLRNIKAADLEGADFTRAYLAGSDLSSEVNLDGVTLTDACLRGVNLAGSDLTKATLNRADLTRADLTGAILTGVDLRGVDLTGANLTGANLLGVNLKGANLWGAILKGANLPGAILEGANLWGVNLEGVNLEGAILKGAILKGANLKGVNLEGANLEGANLKRANLHHTTFRKVRPFTWQCPTCSRGKEYYLLPNLPEPNPTCSGTVHHTHIETELVLKNSLLQRSRRWISRAAGYLAFGKRSSSADLSDVNLENVKGSKDAKWPGPFDLRKVHNTEVPSLTGARFKLTLVVLSLLLSSLLIVNTVRSLLS